jgi:hypothetical protein
MIYDGIAINLKTAKPIRFQIPHLLSTKGIETIQKNLRITKLTPSQEVHRLQNLMQYIKPGVPWVVFNPRTGNPEYEYRYDQSPLKIFQHVFDTSITIEEGSNILRILCKFMPFEQNEQNHHESKPN